ncbi:MAG: glycosyltransferase family 2 protein [Candidatus Nanohaloarchaea archaeon]
MESVSIDEVTPKPTIGGVFTVRNALDVGYPFLESLVSAIPIMDELVVVDGGSDDGTLDLLEKLADTYPIITVVEREELNPTTGHDHIDSQVMYAIEMLDTDWVMEIQADEVWDTFRLPALTRLINKADSSGANSIRMPRIHCHTPNGFNFLAVRLVRNLPDLNTSAGGDSFSLSSKKPRPESWDYGRNYAPPEYQTELYFIHLSTPRDKASHRARHAKWLAKENDARYKMLEDTVGEEKAKKIVQETSESEYNEVFGESKIHKKGKNKEELIDNLNRVSATPKSDTILQDRFGRKYRHGTYKGNGGKIELEQGQTSEIDRRTFPCPWLPFTSIDQPASDKNNMIFKPKEMEEKTGTPYTKLTE